MRIPEDFDVSEARMRTMVVPSDLRAAKVPEDRIIDELGRWSYDPDSVFAIKLALEEALTNAVKHGNKNDRAKQVVVSFSIDPQRAIIMVRDEGPGFRPDCVPDCTADENLERPNGRGIMLIHAYMTKVRFNETGNELWMLKENPAAAVRSTPPPSGRR
jgi:serine/threonine-protein kinase RsbW